MVLPLKILELEFTILEFHKHYVISKPREGQILEAKQIADLVEVCSEFYSGKAFVYLSYRINDYNVNPIIYLNIEKVRNLAAIGIVCKKESSLNTARFEKQFCKLPYEIFTDLMPAREWAKKMAIEKK